LCENGKQLLFHFVINIQIIFQSHPESSRKRGRESEKGRDRERNSGPEGPSTIIKKWTRRYKKSTWAFRVYRSFYTYAGDSATIYIGTTET